MSLKPADLIASAKASLKLKTPGVLTVMAYTSFFPVCYRDAKNRVVGSDVDIIQRFAKTLGLRVKYVFAEQYHNAYSLTKTWDLEDACDADADMGIGGIAMTSERQSKHVVWSMPYTSVKRTLVYNLKAPVRRFPEDVSGTIMGTMSSTGFEDAYNRLRRKRKAQFLTHEEHGEKVTLRMLLDGKIQGAMRGSMVGETLVRQFPKQLGMTAPWTMDAKVPETFRFPCLRRSGIEPLLSAFLGASLADGTLSKVNDAAMRSAITGIPKTSPALRERGRRQYGGGSDDAILTAA